MPLASTKDAIFCHNVIASLLGSPWGLLGHIKLEFRPKTALTYFSQDTGETMKCDPGNPIGVNCVLKAYQTAKDCPMVCCTHWQEVNSRNTVFMLQCIPPGICAWPMKRLTRRCRCVFQLIWAQVKFVFARAPCVPKCKYFLIWQPYCQKKTLSVASENALKLFTQTFSPSVTSIVKVFVTSNN